ncbi:hypothetical protein EDC96DRAFT_541752 [Choanephora cucurbitarum]|nr:hypothetical protein EDC96DRAFT_541752 [Choanephora cucurbitarum]
MSMNSLTSTSINYIFKHGSKKRFRSGQAETTNVRRISCNQPGHSRRTFRGCPLNPANISSIEATATLNDPMEVDTIDSSVNLENQQTSIVQCSACHQFGHSRRANHLCPLYTPPNAVQNNSINDRIAMQTDFLSRRHSFGRMSYRCPFCDAFTWPEERAEGGVSTARQVIESGVLSLKRIRDAILKVRLYQFVATDDNKEQQMMDLHD